MWGIYKRRCTKHASLIWTYQRCYSHNDNMIQLCPFHSRSLLHFVQITTYFVKVLSSKCRIYASRLLRAGKASLISLPPLSPHHHQLGTVTHAGITAMLLLLLTVTTDWHASQGSLTGLDYTIVTIDVRRACDACTDMGQL